MCARHWVEWLTLYMWEASFSDWSPRRLLLELTDLERTKGRKALTTLLAMPFGASDETARFFLGPFRLPLGMRERPSQNRDEASGLSLQFEVNSLGGCSSTAVARTMLNQVLAANPKASVCASQQQSPSYENFTVRFNRSCDTLYTGSASTLKRAGSTITTLCVPWSSHGCL
jgi:hypothetical protein